ncbi:MAG: hypothetical protein RDV48_26350 [Candidatus Eremiobacteraeota bacterium]|nr:hypothetical protein [Candidatus Eremiobacteraeota bacterium]
MSRLELYRAFYVIEGPLQYFFHWVTLSGRVVPPLPYGRAILGYDALSIDRRAMVWLFLDEFLSAAEAKTLARLYGRSGLVLNCLPVEFPFHCEKISTTLRSLFLCPIKGVKISGCQEEHWRGVPSISRIATFVVEVRCGSPSLKTMRRMGKLFEALGLPLGTFSPCAEAREFLEGNAIVVSSVQDNASLFKHPEE